MKKSIDLIPNMEALFGTRDENLRLLEDGLNVSIDMKSNALEIQGAARDVARAEQVFADYDHLRRSGFVFQNGDLGDMLRIIANDEAATLRTLAEAGKQRSLGKRTVQPKKPSKSTTWFSVSDRRARARLIWRWRWQSHSCWRSG